MWIIYFLAVAFYIAKKRLTNLWKIVCKIALRVLRFIWADAIWTMATV